MVPYRDSALTRMLQNALGGNSKTYMICAVRPGAKYFDESVNTLKYADRAKQIKNKAVVNENPQDKMIRELKEENEKLKALLGSQTTAGDQGKEMDEKAKEELKKMQEEMESNRKIMEEMNKSWEQKLAEQQKNMAEENKKI